MAKFLNFTVAETSGRTFEVPMDKVQELIKERGIEDVDFNDDDEVASILKDELLDELASYEKDNQFVEVELCCSKFIGE